MAISVYLYVSYAHVCNDNRNVFKNVKGLYESDKKCRIVLCVMSGCMYRLVLCFKKAPSFLFQALVVFVVLAKYGMVGIVLFGHGESEKNMAAYSFVSI